MAYVTTEERVDRLEALFGQFLTEMAVISRAAEERNRLAEERMSRFENEMRAFKHEMGEFKNEMRASKRELDKKWAELADSMGTLIEDLVAPCGFQLARAIFRTEEAQTCAIRIKHKHPQRPGEMIELDLLAVGPTQALVVEAKRRMNAENAAQFRAKASSLAEFFPDYANRRVHCAVASPYLDPSVVTFLTRERIYGITMGEETMEVVNLDQF
jgi:hypothetical protein